MDIKECYEMLGITKKATDEQVKKAYREKSKQFHPDLHRDDKDATAKFAKVSEAYRLILENREKKHKSIFNFGTIFSDAGSKTNTEKKKETTKSTKKLPMTAKMKRAMAVYIAMVLIMTAGASTVFAADDPLTVINNLSTFIFGLIRAIGMILLGFGIVQVGLSLKSHDPSQRANGFLTLAGGVIITFAKEILNLITG